MIRRIDVNARLSRATIHNGTIYLSGLTADDLGQDVFGQTQQIFAKADRFLKAADSDKGHLLAATIWLRDIADFGRMNEAWESWLTGCQPPARATVQAAMALPNILVEIQFTAAVIGPR